MKKLLSLFFVSTLALASFPGDFPADAGNITIPALTVTTTAAVTGALTAASGTFTAGDSDDVVQTNVSATNGVVRYRPGQETSTASTTYWEFASDFAGSDASLGLNSVLAGAGQTVLSISRGSAYFLIGGAYDLIVDKGLVMKSASTGFLEISGDTDNDLGGTFKAYGSTHATKAGDWELRNTATANLSYDHSATDILAAVPIVLAAGFRHTTASVELTADDQAVTVASLGMITLTSDDGTAANRTFTLAAGGEAGQVLILYWNDADEGQLADTGTVLLVGGAWEPTAVGQTLVLINDGTNWTEISRSTPA